MNHTHRQSYNSTKNNKNEMFDFLKPSKLLAKPFIPRATAQPPKPARPPADNKLLAGYLAHEFLTKGTLFGQLWDPARAEAQPVSAAPHFRKPGKQAGKGKLDEPKPGDKRKLESYAEVSGVLMGKNGVHIPGIVNPTQMTRFLHLQ